jgi:hypothetical protein
MKVKRVDVELCIKDDTYDYMLPVIRELAYNFPDLDNCNFDIEFEDEFCKKYFYYDLKNIKSDLLSYSFRVNEYLFLPIIIGILFDTIPYIVINEKENTICKNWFLGSRRGVIIDDAKKFLELNKGFFIEKNKSNFIRVFN